MCMYVSFCHFGSPVSCYGVSLYGMCQPVRVTSRGSHGDEPGSFLWQLRKDGAEEQWSGNAEDWEERMLLKGTCSSMFVLFLFLLLVL